MKILLQNKHSLAFIGGLAGTWTKHKDKAHVFKTGLEALMFCFRRRLPNMQMRARFRDPTKDFTVPVTDHYGGT